MPESNDWPTRERGRFATTHWSLIIAAGDKDDPSAREALASLCRSYWPPIYAYLRRQGRDRDVALDLTQGFFAKLLEKHYVADARRERGRFRTFLLTSLQHFVANEWDRERAFKRGGGQATVSLDAAEAEYAYSLEPVDQETPERIFDRRWARSLLDAGLSRLRDESPDAAGRDHFDRLVPFLTGESDEGYRDAATSLATTEGALRVAVHRMRARFRSILKNEVEKTLDDPAHVDDELRHLFAVLGS